VMVLLLMSVRCLPRLAFGRVRKVLKKVMHAVGLRRSEKEHEKGNRSDGANRTELAR